MLCSKYTPDSHLVFTQSVGANFDRCLNASPYFMKRKGIGRAMVASTAKMVMAMGVPSPENIGLASNGRPAAETLRRMVLAEMALAAYN